MDKEYYQLLLEQWILFPFMLRRILVFHVKENPCLSHKGKTFSSMSRKPKPNKTRSLRQFSTVFNGILLRTKKPAVINKKIKLTKWFFWIVHKAYNSICIKFMAMRLSWEKRINPSLSPHSLAVMDIIILYCLCMRGRIHLNL